MMIENGNHIDVIKTAYRIRKVESYLNARLVYNGVAIERYSYPVSLVTEKPLAPAKNLRPALFKCERVGRHYGNNCLYFSVKEKSYNSVIDICHLKGFSIAQGLSIADFVGVSIVFFV